MEKSAFNSLFFSSLKLIVKAIARHFGPNCEVVLHDLANFDRSIVAIENGHITGRKVGGPIIGGPSEDIGLEMFIKGDVKNPCVAGYESKTANGKTLKSTSILFRDTNGLPLAALCINTDLTEFLMSKRVLDNFCTLSSISQTLQEEEKKEENKNDIALDVEETLRNIISESIEMINIPVHLMDKEHKVNAVRFMFQRGVFLVKGGVERAAQALAVSRFTVYNYLDEIKTAT